MIGQNISNRVSEQLEWVGDESQEIVNHYPISTALVVFGLGVGAGVAIVSLMCDHPRTYAQEASHITHRLGRQMLDAMSHVLPDSVTKKWS